MSRNKRQRIGFRLWLTRIILWLGLSMAISISTYGNVQGAPKFPTRAVDIIVSAAPGGSYDYVGRFFAAEFSKRWGQPVNVINKAGGNNVIGTQAAMSSRPDGYTIFVDGVPTSSAQIGIKGIPYDVMNRTFLAVAVASPMVIALSKSSPWNSLKELAEGGRKDPASVVWGAAGGGRSAADVVLLQFFDIAGIDIPKTRRADFSGTGTVLNALAGGHIKLAGSPPMSVKAAASSGNAKVIAYVNDNRTHLFPDVPTAREAGFPALDFVSWQGFSGPPGMPAEVQEVYVKTIEEIMKDPKIVSTLAEKFDAIPMFLGPADFKAHVIKNANQIERLLKLMNAVK